MFGAGFSGKILNIPNLSFRLVGVTYPAQSFPIPNASYTVRNSWFIGLREQGARLPATSSHIFEPVGFASRHLSLKPLIILLRPGRVFHPIASK